MAAKVALVHDWLTNQGGGERVLWQLHELYPEAPIYTSVYYQSRMTDFAKLDVRTSFLQRWPLAKSRHQLYSLLRPMAFESFDFSSYDLVISTNSAEAKGIVTSPGTVHISYVFTPTRYYWSGYHEYLSRPNLGLFNPLAHLIGPGLISRLREWDYAAAQRADHIIGISRYVNQRIHKYYRRQAELIYPPVDTKRFDNTKDRQDYYLVVSRLVPYKQIELAVQACTRMKRPLKVAGSGSELAALQRMAGPTVKFITQPTDGDITDLYSRAKGFIFTPEEDFGITPLEAMASGCPVIAYGRGGALETVIDGETGVFFNEPTIDSVVEAIKRFEATSFDVKKLRTQAERFSNQRFRREFKAFDDNCLKV